MFEAVAESGKGLTFRVNGSATQRGVFGFLTKPFDSQELLQKVAAAVRLAGDVTEPSQQSSGEWRAGIVTRSPRMEDLLRQARLHTPAFPL